jgi:hypothetical protein
LYPKTPEIERYAEKKVGGYMVRGDKNPLAEVTSPASNEGEEIDRIMKEIEDLEKKMDATSNEQDTTTVTAENGSTEDGLLDPEPVAPVVKPTAKSEKVVALRPTFTASGNTSDVGESLAESDAVPASQEPLMREHASAPEGGLALKIGGCTDVSLEFARAGMTVTLSCNDQGLCISTDQGAEFRIPFKRTA